MALEQQKRQELFDTMIVHEGIDVKHTVERMKQNASRYTTVAKTIGMPEDIWYVVAVIHLMEAGLDFTKYLGNGQDLSKVTTIVPKGRGPFKTFEEGAVDALKLQNADNITDWSMGNILYFLESFNGFGYEKYHHMNSPYLWAGSNHYVKGKYSSDGKFDYEAVSGQIGVAILIKELVKQ